MSIPTPAQNDAFAKDGWLKVDGLLDPRLVAGADACAARMESRVSFNERGWGQSTTSSREVMDLFGGPVKSLLEAMAGAPVRTLGVRMYPVAVANDNCQLAYMRNSPGACSAYNAHVDGAPNPGQRHLNKHSAMIGVPLTPVRAPLRGNYTVWPGSHRHVSSYLTQSFAGTNAVEAIWGDFVPPADCLPLQVLAEPGDVLVIHHLLLHGTACNASGETRRMAFFRVNFEFYADTDLARFADLWGDWRGLGRELESHAD